ncbi:cation:proton antiporter [Saccharopolyspora sp. 5N102]|uniref:cation:proton antiporter n=1 Tax=Saccharopolyspora sp. 5N102 TaxID=3375155 RepID=UPI0037B03A0C
MSPDHVIALFLALAFIVTAARVLGELASRLNQPPVIGEILFGILLGPTLLGGAITNIIFPIDIRPLLSTLADIGVALFMFTVGAEVDRRLLRGQARVTMTVALFSFVLPFLLGCALAFYLATHHPNSQLLGFVLFTGIAMSVTAFPVLARILSDRKMNRTPVGGLALSCAAVGDVLAWSFLAAITTAVGGPDGPKWHVVLIVPFVLVMIFAVRPALRRLYESWQGDRTGRRMLVVGLAGLFVSGALTEWMGLHFIFGAFLFGTIVPRDEHGQGHAHVWEGTARVSSFLLLPIYFVVAGFDVDLSRIDATNLVDFALIMLVSVGGKFAGTVLAARMHRVAWRHAAILGALMNTRGLTELIVLTVGLQLGLIDRGLYSLMVLMAVLTTAMSGPLLQLLSRGSGVLDRNEIPTAGTSGFQQPTH